MKNILIAILLCLPATAFSQVAKSNVSAGKLSADLDTKVSKSGDTMTGQLTTASTITVQGNAFSVGGSTLVVTEGKVGIGTASPSTHLLLGMDLAIVNPVGKGYPGMGIASYANSDTNQGVISFQKSRSNTPGAHTIVQAGDTLGAINFYGSNGSAFSYSSAIRGLADSGVGPGSDMPGVLSFLTSADGSANVIERARITSAGSVGIGTTSPSSKLQIGTSLNSTTDYMQIDTLEADTAGPPASADCDASTEVGRMVVSTRYSETADHALYVCIQTGAETYAWYKTALAAP